MVLTGERTPEVRFQWLTPAVPEQAAQERIPEPLLERHWVPEESAPGRVQMTVEGGTESGALNPTYSEPLATSSLNLISAVFPAEAPYGYILMSPLLPRTKRVAPETEAVRISRASVVFKVTRAIPVAESCGLLTVSTDEGVAIPTPQLPLTPAYLATKSPKIKDWPAKPLFTELSIY